MQHKTRLLLVLAALAAALAVGGCKGTVLDRTGGDEDPQPAERFVVESLGLQGTTDQDCGVTIGGQPDRDGADDQRWEASFLLDSGSGAGSLPADSGELQVHTVAVGATPVGGGKKLHKRVTITLYE